MSVGLGVAAAAAGMSALGGLASTGINAWQAQLNRDFNAREAEKARAFNASEAQKIRDYDERMSNTAITRRYNELNKLGINPILAAMDGASTPSAAAASSSPASASGSNISNIDSRIRLSDLQEHTATRAALLAEINNSAAVANQASYRLKDDKAILERSELVQSIADDNIAAATDELYRMHYKRKG